MIVHRLCSARYAGSLQSSGAANRWNKTQEYVIYTSGTVSLCALELLAHTSGIRPSGSYKMMTIAIRNDAGVQQVSEKKLPDDWNSISSYHLTQDIGSAWYELRECLVLQVPSAIISSEYNFVLNTTHPAFAEMVSIVETQDFFWDRRFPAAAPSK